MAASESACSFLERCFQSKLLKLAISFLILTAYFTETLGAEGTMQPPPRKPSQSPPSRPPLSPWKSKSPSPSPPPPPSPPPSPPPPKGASSPPLNLRPPSPAPKPSPRLPPPSPRAPPVLSPSPSPPLPVPPTPARYRPRDGIRLVGGTTKGIGRLELLTSEGEWIPICGPLPDDNLPKLLCELLGYRYGRSYYADDLNKVVSNELIFTQSLRGCNLTAAPNDGSATQVGEYTCWLTFEYSKCMAWYDYHVYQNLAALQCSNTDLPPAPPPYPNPPPPPPRGAQKDTIRLVSTRKNVVSYLESSYRAELLVRNSSDGRTGSAVWAPLCVRDIASYTYQLTRDLSTTICRQGLAGYVDDSGVKYLHGYSEVPLPVALQAQPEIPNDYGDMYFTLEGFNPKNYTYWVTVVGGVKRGVFAVQQFDLKVTTEPCSSGFMFHVQCSTD